MRSYLAILWLIILSVTLFCYIVYDGKALGLGIIIPFVKKNQKNRSFDYLVTNWDLNQTWLVFTLAGLYAGFSKSFATTFSLFYLPFMLLLLALVCRGASIEYCIKSHFSQLWQVVLAFSSAVVIALQSHVIVQFCISLSSNPQTFTLLPTLVITSLTFTTLFVFNIISGLYQIKLHRFLFHRYYWHLSFLGLVSFEILFLMRHITITHVNITLLMATITLTLISSSVLYSLALRHKSSYYKILGLLATLQIYVELYFFPYLFPGQVNFMKTAANDSALLKLILLAITVLPVVIGVYIYVQRFYYKRFRISSY